MTLGQKLIPVAAEEPLPVLAPRGGGRCSERPRKFVDVLNLEI
jgi:hypothetical protein